MIMNARALGDYIRPLLIPELNHVKNIRIGTKSVAYWPQRYVTDKDTDDVLRLFEEVVASGKNLALMAHYNHPQEMQTEISQTALKRIIATGATVRMQSPLIRHINENPQGWATLWTTGVRLGAIPYYMFVERDTGPNEYFGLPLYKAWQIFQQAYKSVSGLARTVRGPSMSALPSKVMIDGTTEIAGEKVFVLQFLQARNPDWVRRPFFAKYDQKASWLWPLKGQSFDDYQPYNNFFIELISSDLEQALLGNMNSPLKASTDVLRDVCEALRKEKSVVWSKSHIFHQLITQDFTSRGALFLSNPNRTFDGETVHDLSVTIQIIKPEDSTTKHSHSFWHLYFVMSGRGEIILENKNPAIIVNGDVIYVPAWIEHKFINCEHENLILYVTQNLPSMANQGTLLRKD
ncbi:cupin domain-containing protein [Xenorhabdus sp. Sc-CR9]|uniref:cupin domain-containing protein n=1 Tax=Xenorhabdus sp. Sc-CR9 TaxID=2584468 RepID=UPI001F19A0A6|nr:cupin domain-containing protein [Xenorhabdus sp. Sc-CR9]